MYSEWQQLCTTVIFGFLCAFIGFAIVYFKKRINIIESAFKDQANVMQNMLAMINTIIRQEDTYIPDPNNIMGNVMNAFMNNVNNIESEIYKKHDVNNHISNDILPLDDITSLENTTLDDITYLDETHDISSDKKVTDENLTMKFDDNVFDNLSKSNEEVTNDNIDTLDNMIDSLIDGKEKSNIPLDTRDNYKSMNISKLRELCKDRGIPCGKEIPRKTLINSLENN